MLTVPLKFKDKNVPPHRKIHFFAPVSKNIDSRRKRGQFIFVMTKQLLVFILAIAKIIFFGGWTFF